MLLRLCDILKETSQQLLVALPWLDDTHVKLLWAGDLDGDGSLDLLIDTAHKYSYSQPTLFLSSMATGNELLTSVANCAHYSL